MTPHMCPVCREHEFDRIDSFEICPKCGWQDDWYQEKNPNEDRLANEMSLIEYKKAYESGWRADWIGSFYFS